MKARMSPTKGPPKGPRSPARSPARKKLGSTSKSGAKGFSAESVRGGNNLGAAKEEAPSMPTPVGSSTDLDESSLYAEPTKRIIRPHNQLKLSEECLEKELTRVLTADDPNVPANITKFNYKERVYKVEPPGPGDHLALHFSMDGSALHCDSEEAKLQAQAEKKRQEEKQAMMDAARKEMEDGGGKVGGGVGAGAGGGTAAGTATAGAAAAGGGGTAAGAGATSSLASGSPATAAISGAAGVATAAAGAGPVAEEAEAASYAARNQFNYSERAAQTYNNSLKDRSVETVPPPTVQYKSTVSQWLIYDAYMLEYENSMRSESAAFDMSKLSSSLGSSAAAAAPGVGTQSKEEMIHSQVMEKNLKILERMVNQNADDEIFHDFKFWEDQSDQFREGEGSLLPLWRFSSEKPKKKHVTALAWNPGHPALFAVGYGSYDYLKQGSGVICCFSLKNPSHPEFQFSTESGVMSLDFHPRHTSLLAVGCCDGTVMVFDVRVKGNKPIYCSSIKTGKHSDPVWQVCWQEEELAKELSFCSISSDGRVANWVMSKNELKMEPFMQLKLASSLSREEDMLVAHSASSSSSAASSSLSGSALNNSSSDGAAGLHSSVSGSGATSSASSSAAAAAGGGTSSSSSSSSSSTSSSSSSAPSRNAAVSAALLGEGALSGLAGGCCLDFHPQLEHLFLVGTEEGRVHKCSRAYSGSYLQTFEGHHMVVYAVRWNPFHPRLFLSCSADWTVKLWDQASPRCLLSFDLGNAVGDVFWAPYSASVFGAVTNDGKVHIFDLAVNKHEPLCVQKVVNRAKLTHLAFSQTYPIVIVGDSRAGVNCLKLSPNLRKDFDSAPARDGMSDSNSNSSNNSSNSSSSSSSNSSSNDSNSSSSNSGGAAPADHRKEAKRAREVEKMEKLLSNMDGRKPELQGHEM